VLELIRRRGVEIYPGSVRFVEAARTIGLRRAVVSASKNCREVLAAAGIEDLFEARVDGIVAQEAGLRGKPAPDMFLHAAAVLGVRPAESAVFEDAVAGVEAGRAGGFGWVVGVDRVGQAAALRSHGADVVVSDLSELLEKR
jgi:HAD superfamily hydrolase (TIGR01509 family)